MLIILCGLTIHVFSVVPSYYGARSLSLGYASSAFNYDINSIFINPAILSSNDYQLYGYQYQNSYLDDKNFQDRLSEVLGVELANFSHLNAQNKTALFSKLKDLYGSKNGMNGYSSSIPGFVSKGYGFAVSFVNTAVVSPVDPGTGIFNKDISEVTNEDIASLNMNFLGLKYKQISLAYGLQIYSSIHLGIAVHYLNGKINDFNRSIVSDIFTAGTGTADYLRYGWTNAGKDGGKSFSKIVSDVGLNIGLGNYFTVGMAVKNFGKAKIQSPVRDIQIPRRFTAGLAFRPNPSWGFYLDMDLQKADLLYTGEAMQPISFGIEKGFFNNKLFVRGGMFNDLNQKHFLGNESNALYGLGLGFNLKNFIVDLAIGLNSGGSVKNLAVSGFILVK